MSRTKKDCSVILFDLTSKSREAAVQCLMKICCNNFFTDSKNLTKLILVNSDTTENSLAARYGGYEHIYEVSKEDMLYNPQLILEMIETSGTGKANWLEAISVGIKSLQESGKSIKNIIAYQLLFLTDLESSLPSYNKKIIKEIADDISQIQAFFYIVGPDIQVPFTIKNPEQVKLWMETLQVDSDNKNLAIVKEIISKTENTVICNYKMGVHLFFSYKCWGGGQPWQVPLGIGTKVQIPAQTVKVLEEGMQCLLVSPEERFGKQMWVAADDESINIDPADVKEGIMLHEKFVLMPDNKLFDVQNPRSFSVLCFTDSTNVPEFIMRGEEGHCVIPNGTPENNKAMNILIDCLASQEKYIIARRIYNNNFVPKIVVLIPKLNYMSYKCFLLASLPFGEDIVTDYIEKNVEKAPKSEVVDEVYDFLDTIDIDNERKGKTLPLGISMMLDTDNQKIINKTADKYMEKRMGLKEVDIDYIGGVVNTSATEPLKKIWEEWAVTHQVATKEEMENYNSEDEFDW